MACATAPNRTPLDPLDQVARKTISYPAPRLSMLRLTMFMTPTGPAALPLSMTLGVQQIQQQFPSILSLCSALLKSILSPPIPSDSFDTPDIANDTHPQRAQTHLRVATDVGAPLGGVHTEAGKVATVDTHSAISDDNSSVVFQVGSTGIRR